VAIAAAAQVTKEQEKFLKLVTPPALTAERRLEVPAAVIIAQAILECAWGKSRLFTEGHNPFGIKNLELPEDYGEYQTPTTEYVNGKPVTVVAEFERFRDLDQAFFHHALLFWRAKRYWPALKVRRDPFAFAASIGRCGYATDPCYGEKLSKLITEFGLNNRAALNDYAGGDPVAGQGVEGTDL
jgi:flagellum-specific peptidoglycan hydrolase FlgJ